MVVNFVDFDCFLLFTVTAEYRCNGSTLPFNVKLLSTLTSFLMLTKQVYRYKKNIASAQNRIVNKKGLDRKLNGIDNKESTEIFVSY